MVGIAFRRTKEIDFVIKYKDEDIKSIYKYIESILKEIIAIEMEDATKFTLLGLVQICEADCQEFKARLEVTFDRIKTEIQINITVCGETISKEITLREINYSYPLKKALSNLNSFKEAVSVSRVNPSKIEEIRECGLKHATPASKKFGSIGS